MDLAVDLRRSFWVITMQSFPVTQQRENENLDCIHCGICLSVCPTYLLIGNEADSPRGRIYLMKAANEGRIRHDSGIFNRHMSLCLECRACETACPSGVQFSLMMNDARAAIRSCSNPSSREAFLRRLVFDFLLPNRRFVHWCFRFLRFYQFSGIRRLVRFTRLLRLLSKRLAILENLLPDVPKMPKYESLQPPSGGGKHRVALFEGCIMAELFGPVHEATVRVLVHNDIAVCSPPGQNCCGALHLHDGDVAGSLKLARENIEAFERDGSEFIVVNAAGCGAMLKEYGRLLRDDGRYDKRALSFSSRVRDITEFLDAIEIKKAMSPINLKVTYDDPCHLLHGQGIKTAPRRLLKSIPGISFVELRDADRCCGSAGIYNITQPETSARILDEKVANIILTGANIIASGNPGCLLQLRQGLQAKRLPIRAVHPIELLDQAYQKGRQPNKASAG